MLYSMNNLVRALFLSLLDIFHRLYKVSSIIPSSSLVLSPTPSGHDTFVKT